MFGKMKQKPMAKKNQRPQAQQPITTPSQTEALLVAHQRELQGTLGFGVDFPSNANSRAARGHKMWHNAPCRNANWIHVRVPMGGE